MTLGLVQTLVNHGNQGFFKIEDRTGMPLAGLMAGRIEGLGAVTQPFRSIKCERLREGSDFRLLGM